MIRRWMLAATVGLIGLLLGAGITVSWATDGPLTSALNLGVRVNENGHLMITTGSIGATDGPLTNFGNVALRTDENGYLITAVGSQTKQSATVNGATTFALTSSYVVLACTDAETINTITGGKTGMELVIENSDTDCTIADDDDATAANAIDLTGSGNDTGAVAKVMTFLYNGTHWLQMSESDN